ncbi:hypothetical protein [Streptomyces sp. NBC_00009]|uniref:hypothetical protein n=1 Tax=Streptomyces sp. NBC_00009 TaxID=2975620 RepID=UPI00324397C2
MHPWVVDAFVAGWITTLDVLLLVGYSIYEGIRQWPSEEHARALTTRLCLVLTIGAAGFAVVGFVFYRVELVVAAVSQLVLAAVILVLLLMGFGTECARWVARRSHRHRLVRERHRMRGR